MLSIILSSLLEVLFPRRMSRTEHGPKAGCSSLHWSSWWQWTDIRMPKCKVVFCRVYSVTLLVTTSRIKGRYRREEPQDTFSHFSSYQWLWSPVRAARGDVAGQALKELPWTQPDKQLRQPRISAGCTFSYLFSFSHGLHNPGWAVLP